MTELQQVGCLVGLIYVVGLSLYARACRSENERTKRGVRICPDCSGAGLGIVPYCEPCSCMNGEVPL